MMDEFSKFKKIDAHTHIGKFGSPFNIDFDGDRLIGQMHQYNIDKTILCSASGDLNEETAVVYRQHPDQDHSGRPGPMQEKVRKPMTCWSII